MKRKFAYYKTHFALNVPESTLYKPRYKILDMTWEFHKGDEDFFPSVPHGHSDKYKLNTVNGEVYDIKAKIIVGKIKDEEFKKLKKDRKFIEYAKEQIEWYRKQYPDREIKTPDWINDANTTSVSMSYYKPQFKSDIKMMAFAPGYKPKEVIRIKLKTVIKK